MSTPFKLKGHTLPGPNQAAPLKQKTTPPKVKKENIFRGKIVTSSEGTKTYYDKSGKVRKIKENGKVTKYKKGNREFS